MSSKQPTLETSRRLAASLRFVAGALGVALLLGSCAQNVPLPEFGDDSLLPGAAPVPAGRLALLEGTVRVPASDANRRRDSLGKRTRRTRPCSMPHLRRARPWRKNSTPR